MTEAITAAATLAVEEIAAYVGRLRFAPPSSSRVGKIRQGIERLTRMVAWIRAGVNDAEEVEIGDQSVHLWMRELEGIASAAEDVLDEFLYEVLRLRLMEGGGGFPPAGLVGEAADGVAQVCSSSSSAQGHEILGFLVEVEQRIEATMSRFDEIRKQMGDLHFPKCYEQKRAKATLRQPTSSLVEETRVFGRENDLKEVEKFLLSDIEPSGSSSVPVMAIVGMGGLGKTTLAQVAYSCDHVKRHFDLRLWICASENFDVVRLTRAMIESSTHKACHLSELDPLHFMLQKELDGKKFLLVLDDVWEEENLSGNWDTLAAPLRSGSTGSKIIITTRNEKVARMTRAVSTYRLPCLQDEDCLKLFSRQALEGGEPDSYPNMMTIGRKISQRCRGVPLVAKTLGGLLRCEDDEQMWNDILEGDILDIEENGIMPILKLSYQHLPAHLKRCFKYCSAFPKDYEFDKDRLVMMWMAHGYVPSKGRKQMEDVGRDFFNDLLSRSFFQYSQKPNVFLMHDLIHDLARCVSKGEYCSAEGNKPWNILEHGWHLSIVSNSEPAGITSPEHIHELGALRSFLFISPSFRWINCMEILNDLFTKVIHLRVLDLSGTGLKDLPNSIGCLKYLRYLGLRTNPINYLPKSVGILYHLQTLDLQFCNWVCLPDVISNLLNLRHLICGRIVEYPLGIRKLTHLQMMPGFQVSPLSHRAKLGELKDISNIQSLTISGLNYLIDVDEAKKACLEKKRYLRSLDLRWDEYLLSGNNDVLESLKPCTRLECLRIYHFSGLSLPSWLGHPSFFKLATVELVGCQNWTSLPPLGQLPSLKCLSIESAQGVKFISHEFFSGGFPRLETLKLKSMNDWKSWCGAQRGQCPHLSELIVSNCPNLASLSVINLCALQNLQIHDCPALQFSAGSLQLGQLPSLQRIRMAAILGAEYVHSGFFWGGFLETVQLVGVHKLVAWSGAAEGECPRLRELFIGSCAKLTSLHLGNLDALEQLDIRECNRLRFPDENKLPPKLEVLSIYHCMNLTCLPLGNVNALKNLEIRRCPQLSFSNVDQLPPTLKVLSIHDCANLTSLPLGMSSKLQVLSVNGCPSLTDWCQHHRQRLAHIPHLQVEGIDKHVVLQNVCSVQEAADAYLGALPRLRTLELVWDRNVGNGAFEDEEPEQVLERLRPHNNLNKLEIRGYSGSRFPTWLGDPSFSNLVYMTLLSCSQCKILPPLSQLPHLMELYIEGMDTLKCIGNEFINGSCSTSSSHCFPSLRKLELKDMPSFEEWVVMEDGYLPSLCELILMCCPLLKMLPCMSTSLKELEVEKCDIIMFPPSFKHLTSLHTMRISQLPLLTKLPELPLGLRRLTVRSLPSLVDLVTPPSLRDLVLESCSERMIAASLPHFTLLTSLRISDFLELVILPLHNLEILQELHLSNCPKLVHLHCSSSSFGLHVYGLKALKSLEHLSISDCPRLLFPENEVPPSALQSIDITNCPLLASWHNQNWRNRRGINR